MLFNKIYTIEMLQSIGKNTLSDLVGIEYVEIGEDFLVARMPVDKRTHQPMGLLHGGASMVLAETIGSVASMMCFEDPMAQQVVGLEINANHIRGIRSGYVYARCTPLHIGRSTHVWDIKITDENQKMVCISRFTAAVLAPLPPKEV